MKLSAMLAVMVDIDEPEVRLTRERDQPIAILQDTVTRILGAQE